MEASDAGPLSEYVNRRDAEPIDALGHCDTVTFSGDAVHGEAGGGGGDALKFAAANCVKP